MNNSTVFNVENLRTGDLILFSGTCFVSRLVRLFTRSKWSHIGMVIIDPAYPIPLIYEASHGTSLIGIDVKRQTSGVQLLLLRDRIRTFRGDMVVRRLQGTSISLENRADLLSLRKELVGRPFEQSKWQLVAAEFDSYFLPRGHDLSSVFCSELVAECYKTMGLLGQDLPSNKYSPADFSADRELELVRGNLGPEIRLKLYRR